MKLRILDRYTAYINQSKLYDQKQYNVGKQNIRQNDGKQKRSAEHRQYRQSDVGKTKSKFTNFCSTKQNNTKRRETKTLGKATVSNNKT